MPVPKRKTSKRRRDQRQSAKFIRPQQFAACSNCESPVGGHQACGSCGFYKGKKVLVSKLERAVKRQELRKKAQQAQGAQQPQEQE